MPDELKILKWGSWLLLSLLGASAIYFFTHFIEESLEGLFNPFALAVIYTLLHLSLTFTGFLRDNAQVITGALSAPLTCWALVIGALIWDCASYMYTIVTITLILALVAIGLSIKTRITAILVVYIFAAYAVLSFLDWTGSVEPPLNEFLIDFAKNIGFGLFLLIMSMVLIIGCHRFLHLISYRLTIFNAGPLKEKIESMISSAPDTPKNTPCFITTCFEAEIVDPDSGEIHFEGGTGDFGYTGYYELLTSNSYVPSYLNTNHLRSYEITDVCMASAALPLGVVPSIKLRMESLIAADRLLDCESALKMAERVYGKENRHSVRLGCLNSASEVECVDGGVMDNTPFLPFMYSDIYPDPVEEIWVVLLQECATDEEAEIESGYGKRKFIRLRRLIEQAIFPRTEAWLGVDDSKLDWLKDKIDPPRLVPYRTSDRNPKIIYFYPKKQKRSLYNLFRSRKDRKKRIGGIFSGTLNFSSAYAKDMLKKGQAEAESKMDELGL